MPSIDIIIPVYNQAKKIEKCFESIYNQTFKNISLIIVNDGSTDKIEGILKKIKAQKLIPIKIINQKNQGANAARNRGARETQSEFILFCDADIILKPTMLEKMYSVLITQPHVSYVYSSFKFGFKKFTLWQFQEDTLRHMPYIHTASLLRREHFPGFDENITRLQDWDLWLTMLEKKYKGQWIDEILFTVKSGGTMSKWFPKFFVTFFKRNKSVRSYLQAVEIIKKKHNI